MGKRTDADRTPSPDDPTAVGALFCYAYLAVTGALWTAALYFIL